ncbi:LOB domain-containing protein 16 [Salvia miltiorrhiza]|uniref:LOB domain-containing protein 16 n=1 Tax=Salvia miltiorrhiza TaxID=226208 RepID=UPI0025ACF485|nr:LOB domain-containing protein 16 [Salvia miltiorrhiza]
MASGSGSPCGACKFLRRKCAADCVFAPYFCSEQGPARFAAIHKVFGASNVSKLLLHVPAADRCEAVVTIAYEAQARIRDPVYGCVSHIFALQQQVAYLQAQVMQAKAQLAQNLMDQSSSRNADQTQWNSFPVPNYGNYYSNISPQSSLDSIDSHLQSRDDAAFQHYYTKKRPSQTDLTDLQALALRMMNNQDN